MPYTSGLQTFEFQVYGNDEIKFELLNGESKLASQFKCLSFYLCHFMNVRFLVPMTRPPERMNVALRHLRFLTTLIEDKFTTP